MTKRAWLTSDKKVANVNGNILWGALPPVGSIIPWIGGYFANTSNGGYTRVLGSTNDVSGVNNYLTIILSGNWRVCNGGALNDIESPIWNAAGRYLPNLTDSRFIMGYSTCGTAGGNASNTALITANNLPTHQHAIGARSSDDANANHTHAYGAQYTWDTDPPNHQHDFATGGVNANHQHQLPLSDPNSNVWGDCIWRQGAWYTWTAEWVSSENANHAHDGTTGWKKQAGTHNHYLPASTTAGFGNNHAHYLPATNTGVNTTTATQLNILPQYLQCFYLVRIK